MLQDWLDFCGFSEEERAQAALGLSRLKEASPPNAHIDSLSNWEVLEAAEIVLRRIRPRWAQKILYIWADYYDFLQENPEQEGCDLSWFTPGEPLGAWPSGPEYPVTYDELFEEFVTSEWYGAQRTRHNIRSILRTLVRLFEEINPQHNRVEDFIVISPIKWNQLEASLDLNFTPRTAEYYLTVYQDLFQYIVAKGWRDQPPFKEVEKRSEREVSREQAANEFWGALVEASLAIDTAYSVDQIIAMEESPNPTADKEAALKNWIPKLPTYDIIDALLIIMEVPSPFAREKLGFNRVRSVIQHILNLKGALVFRDTTISGRAIGQQFSTEANDTRPWAEPTFENIKNSVVNLVGNDPTYEKTFALVKSAPVKKIPYSYFLTDDFFEPYTKQDLLDRDLDPRVKEIVQGFKEGTIPMVLATSVNGKVEVYDGFTRAGVAIALGVPILAKVVSQ